MLGDSTQDEIEMLKAKLHWRSRVFRGCMFSCEICQREFGEVGEAGAHIGQFELFQARFDRGKFE